MLWKLKLAGVAQYGPVDADEPLSLCDLEAAKVALLYENLWQPVVSSLVVAAFTAAILWSAHSPVAVMAWFLTLGAISLLRLVFARWYEQGTASAHQKRWLYIFSAGSLGSAALWGAAGVLFFAPTDPTQTAALAVIACGIAAGGTTTLSPVKWLGVGFISLILLPLAAVFLLRATMLSILMGIIVLVFLALMLTTCIRFHRIIHDNIALKVSVESRKAQLQECENRYRSIFDHSPLGVLHFDRNGVITDCNEQLLKILGGTRDSFMGYRMLDRSANQQVAQGVRDSLEKGSGYFEGTFYLPGAEKGTPLRAIFNGVNCDNNHRIGGMAIVEDFTERTRHEATIYRQAYYDSLTDLPNRRLFIERLMSLCKESSNRERTGVVMFLDLDRFKMINDTFGHAAGDDLLIQVAKRLEAHLSDDDMAARLSGDEFVMLKLFDWPFDDRAEEMAKACLETLRSKLGGFYHLESQQVEVTPSMGYTCFNADECDHAEILKQADVAMYQAKAQGRARLCRYRPEMRDVMKKAALPDRVTSLIDR
ncbi:diguanylate cyclase [Halomonas sp. PAMB 3264]|uniref:diguanylate cyclase domain-containing protein n=1 Tax=Halomonas sp. PAMB 3264 TaxID=3075222 RepID=UPI00289B691F|nr:diguanylate cyclase [Halomonas sp. PAMB 3264]WNL43342.1 diguanylate cyclase [Halomonas sp. PAMB 3264]